MFKNQTYNFGRWSIAIRIFPLVCLILLLKYVFHTFGLEVTELNALFTSVIAGTVFLIGFLVSGVLSDYKESEKIPGEVSVSIRNMLDDISTIYKAKNLKAASSFLGEVKRFVPSLIEWFYRNERTIVILDKIQDFNNHLVEFEKEGVQANYNIKIKNEQHNLRKLILRIDTIRDTDFVASAYAVVEVMAFLIMVGLLFIKIEPFSISLFLTGLVMFLIMYMFLLLSDLDNPFDYSHDRENNTEVSLEPVLDLQDILDKY